jgi:hypothetical protein
MNSQLAVDLSAPLAAVVGLLICLAGYRLVKLTLALMGFIAGAAGGWAVGSALAPNNSTVALVCALLGGVIFAILCVWLFFFGVFVLGACAGAVVAAALFRATGYPVQALLILVVAVIFGLLAVVLQKFMIIVSTAFSGSYLVTAAVAHFVTGIQHVHPLWFKQISTTVSDKLGYVALVLWLILGLIGARFQYVAGEKREKAAHSQEKAA